MKVTENNKKITKEQFEEIKKIGVHTGTSRYGLKFEDIDFVLTVIEFDCIGIVGSDSKKSLFNEYPEDEFIVKSEKYSYENNIINIIIVRTNKMKELWNTATRMMCRIIKCDIELKNMIENDKEFRKKIFKSIREKLLKDSK